MKTFQEVEHFDVTIENLQFEEVFSPIEEFNKETIKSVRVFLDLNRLKHYAAEKLIRFVPGVEGKSPSIWYVREGFGKFIPCSINGEMDKFTRSLVLK